MKDILRASDIASTLKKTKCFPSILLNVKQVFHQLTLISNRVMYCVLSKMEKKSDRKEKVKLLKGKEKTTCHSVKKCVREKKG